MKKQKPKLESHSVRIPQDLYMLVRESAEANKRNIVAELSVIIEKYFYRDLNAESITKKHKSIDKLSGIINSLPKGDYTSSIDEVLYNHDL